MTIVEVIAEAIEHEKQLPHQERYKLFDYSSYGGMASPHVVRAPDDRVVFQSDRAKDAFIKWQILESQRAAQSVIDALERHKYKIVEQ